MQAYINLFDHLSLLDWKPDEGPPMPSQGTSPAGHRDSSLLHAHSEPSLTPTGSGMVENVSRCTAASTDGVANAAFLITK